jgi:hypothetical protein
MTNPLSEYRDALARAEELKTAAIAFLKRRKAEIEAEIAKLDGEIAAMAGEGLQKEPRAPKAQGKLISAKLLVDLLKDRPDRTMSPRREGYDTQWIKKLAAENPGKLAFGGNGPWPTVKLVV